MRKRGKGPSRLPGENPTPRPAQAHSKCGVGAAFPARGHMSDKRILSVIIIYRQMRRIYSQKSTKSAVDGGCSFWAAPYQRRMLVAVEKKKIL